MAKPWPTLTPSPTPTLTPSPKPPPAFRTVDTFEDKAGDVAEAYQIENNARPHTFKARAVIDADADTITLFATIPGLAVVPGLGFEACDALGARNTCDIHGELPWRPKPPQPTPMPTHPL